MKSFHKWIILSALIIAAIASYSYGSSQGVFTFIVIGFVFELSFWFGLFKKQKQRAS